MNFVHRGLDFQLDSPTYGRDRANVLSGFTIGTAALLLNSIVLICMLPLMLAADGTEFAQLTDSVDFGQLMALILLGGATLFATLLIPLRLSMVFMQPRIGRYFDQIVLSGISPLRYVIGKAFSQNLFLGLTLFLLLPYLVLSLALGGVDMGYFVAGLFLVWLYCLSLALATLWLSLYVNELASAGLIIIAAGTMCGLGCQPLEFPVFMLSPFPALLQPVYATAYSGPVQVPRDFNQVLAVCTFGMSAFIGGSVFAIYLGPLYGIIRENSMFGEVIRAGDSKRKRWLRFRLHIQRSSEIAFFYQNRGVWIRPYEGLIRWGIGWVGLASIALGAYFLNAEGTRRAIRLLAKGASVVWLASAFHSVVLMIHGFSLAGAVLLFSHARNTTFLRLPLVGRFAAEVSSLDTIAFLLLVTFSTSASIAAPKLFEKYIAAPARMTVFPTPTSNETMQGCFDDAHRFSEEGIAIITVAALVIYAFQRQVCLGMWMKSVAFATVGGLYFILVAVLPLMFAIMTLEVLDDRYRYPFLQAYAPITAGISPILAMVIAYRGTAGPPFPADLTTAPFFIFHAVLLLVALWRLRVTGPKVRQFYLTNSAWNNTSV